jgi:glycosyltransferase involved in cell wall biosynthesis
VNAQRPLRVLWVIKGLGPGGAERLLVSVARAADPDAVTYEVAYVLPWKNHLVGELAGVGVKSHLLGGRRGLANPRWLLRLRTLLRRDFDIVHVHSPAVAAAIRPLVRTMPRRTRPALVATEHNLWSSFGRVTRAANRSSLALDDLHLAVSDEVRESMSPRARAHTQVVVHGVPVDALAARRRERAAQRATFGLADDDIAVTTVANMRWTKDYPTLLRAAVAVTSSHPQVRFLAAGQGPLEAEIRAEAARLGLGERFRVLGYVEDAGALLSASDVFVLASRVEGLPIALLEAMAMGLPVVATAVGGTPTAVTDGVEGRLVAPGRPDELAGAIGEVVGDAELRRTLGAAGALRVRDFDIERAAHQLESLYAGILTR